MANEWWMNNRNNMRGYGNTGVTSVFNPNSMAPMVGRTNWVPQNITEETETIYPADNDLDANWQNQLAGYGSTMDRGNIDNKWYNRITTPVMGIMRAIGDKFQRSPEKQAFYDAVVGERSLQPGKWTRGDYGGNEYEVYQSPTGLKVGSDIIGWGEGYEKNLDSLFGSKSIEEMEDKKIEWAMNRINKGKAISQRLRDALTDRGYLGGDQREDNRWITRRDRGSDYGHTRFEPGSGYYGATTRTNVPTHIGQSLHGSDRSDRTYTGHGRSGMGRDPSDRMASGGRVGLYQGGDPTEWMGQQETVTPFQLQQEEGVPIGDMASNEWNERLLENLFEKYLDLGFSPVEAEKLALEEFESMSQAPQEEVVEEGIASLV